MALEDLNPAVRVEEILDGADIEPATRLEYFMKKAANEVPKPSGSADAGKAVLVNEDGDGYELGEIPSGLPEYTAAAKGKALSVGVKTLPPVTTVVIPEQSVTTTDPITLYGQSAYYGVVNNADTGAVSTSDVYTLTVDGTDYEAAFSLEQDDSLLATVFDAGVGVRIAGDVCQMISFIENDTHTIKLVGVVERKTLDADWESNPLIVKLSLGNGGTYTADKTFAELQEAEESGIPILFSPGRWGIGLAPAEWYDFDSAYTAHLLETVISDNKHYLYHGNVSYSENGITVDWDYRIEMTAI